MMLFVEMLHVTIFFTQVGLYQESIVAYEVVLSDGSLVRATKDNEYSDLYHTLPWSHGTLAFLVALELQIIKIKVLNSHIGMEIVFKHYTMGNS